MNQSRLGGGPSQSTFLSRTHSEQVAASSNSLLTALERGDIDDVRDALIQVEKYNLKRESLLSPSYESSHGLRTPLMCAVRTGNYAIYQTIIHAFDGLFSGKSSSRFNRKSEMRKQLLEHDQDGLTVAMHAARAGRLVVLESVLEEINLCEATAALTAKDHQQMTLLMHSAAAGHSAGLEEVVKALDGVLSDAEMTEHMMMMSGEDQSLLMIAAASSDKMTFKTCVQAVRLAISPHYFRILMKATDAEGMTFMMHAANPGAALSLSGGRRKSSVDSMPTKEDDDSSLDESNSGASVAPATRGPAGSSEAVMKKHSTQRVNLSQPVGDDDDGGDSLADSKSGNDDVESIPRRRATLGGPVQTTNEPMTGFSSLERVAPFASTNFGRRLSYQEHKRHGERLASTASRLRGKKPDRKAQAAAARQKEDLAPASTGMDPRVPVVKAATALNREFLWKEQVRDMLRAKDSWGRTLASHGLLSGSPQVFEVCMEALRADILDEELEVLVQDVEAYEREKTVDINHRIGGKNMSEVVQSKLYLLKRDIDIKAKASTFEAKLQSFIPGKLIVIFQLLLPEVSKTGGIPQLILLLVMTAIAPFLAWASVLVARKKNTGEGFVPRRSVYSLALAAPAMFVWGVGTSQIFEEIFEEEADGEVANEEEASEWPESRSSVILAVGAIVIPAIDGFVNSQRVEQWTDKFSFARWRHARQAEIRWNKLRDRAGKSRRALGAGDGGGRGGKAANVRPDDAEEEMKVSTSPGEIMMRPIPANVPTPILEDSREGKFSDDEGGPVSV